MDMQFMFPAGDGTGTDQKFYYRMDMTPPIVKAGWQVDQASNSKDLSFRLNPSYFQSNPRIGANTAYPTTAGVAPRGTPASTYTLATPGGTTRWNLYDVYDQPV
jgi:hypothetical protein